MFTQLVGCTLIWEWLLHIALLQLAVFTVSFNLKIIISNNIYYANFGKVWVASSIIASCSGTTQQLSATNSNSTTHNDNEHKRVCLSSSPINSPYSTYDNVGHRDAAQLAPVPAVEMFEAVDDGPDEEAGTWGEQCRETVTSAAVVDKNLRSVDKTKKRAHLLLRKIWTGRRAGVWLYTSSWIKGDFMWAPFWIN